MLLALIALAKMLKRRASKRFVLVESNEEPQPAAVGNSNSNKDNGAINVIPNIVAIDHDDPVNNNGNNNISIMHDNNFNNNNNNDVNSSSSSSTSSSATTSPGTLLSVTTAGTLK